MLQITFMPNKYENLDDYFSQETYISKDKSRRKRNLE